MTLSEFILAWRDLAPTTKGRCFYCGRQTSKEGKPHHAHYMTRDHVIPHSTKGWKRVPHGNRVVACRKCNSVKEDLTMHEFKQRSGLATFYAEEVLKVRIDDLSDIAEVTLFITSARSGLRQKVKRRSIKFGGRPEPSQRQDPLPQTASDS
jgi:hypothetical protein